MIGLLVGGRWLGLSCSAGRGVVCGSGGTSPRKSQAEVMGLACSENGAEVACALSDGSVQTMLIC